MFRPLTKLPKPGASDAIFGFPVGIETPDHTMTVEDYIGTLTGLHIDHAP